MCFSPEASFISWGILIAIGVYSITQTPKKSWIPFASIPLLFWLQQLSEWFVRLSFDSSTVLFSQMQRWYIFLFFAEVIRPILIPLSILLIDTNPKKRNGLTALVLLWIAVATYFLYYIITWWITIEITEHHILYSITMLPTNNSLLVFLSFYILVTIWSVLLSSHRSIKRWWYLLAWSLFISLIFYYTYFISVRCFFAALASVLVYKIIIKEKRS